MSSAEIEVFSDFFVTEVVCANGPPDTTDTAAIAVQDIGTPQNTVFGVSLAGGPFISTLAAEGAGDDEIEISLDGGVDGTDNMSFTGTAGNDRWRLGDTTTGGQAVNLNMGEGGSPDADDITMESVEALQAINMGGGDDTLDARGDDSPGSTEAEFTGPFAIGDSTTKQLVPAGGDDHLFAGAGDNWRLEGQGGNDEQIGGADDDDLHLGVGTGADTADGSGGIDTCTYLNHDVDLTVDLRITTAQNTVGAGMDTITACENLSGGDEDDTLIGDEGNNEVRGGENTIATDDGNDMLLGLQGNDVVDGSHGLDDTASYAQGSTGPITVSLGTTAPQATGGAGTDTLPDNNDLNTDPDVENLTGSQFADVLTGNGLDNLIDGGPGGDTINLEAGTDEFNAYDGVLDTVDCGTLGELDFGQADEQGADTLTDCDSDLVDFAPDTSHTGGTLDGALTNDSTPTYELATDEVAPIQFEWNLDGGAWSDCDPSCIVGPVPDGVHTVGLRADDGNEHGNPDPNPVFRSLTVDTVALAPQLSSLAPGGPANANSVRLRGTAGEAVVRVHANGTCADAPAATGTPAELSGAGLALSVPDDSTTTFSASVLDAAGNLSGCSNALSYTEDSTAPKTLIRKRPPNRLQRRKARYRFGSDEAGVSFQCKIDRRRYRSCGARKLYRKLLEGPHRLRVRAVDRAGNVDPTPARDRFRVVL